MFSGNLNQMFTDIYPDYTASVANQRSDTGSNTSGATANIQYMIPLFNNIQKVPVSIKNSTVFHSCMCSFRHRRPFYSLTHTVQLIMVQLKRKQSNSYSLLPPTTF